MSNDPSPPAQSPPSPESILATALGLRRCLEQLTAEATAAGLRLCALHLRIAMHELEDVLRAGDVPLDALAPPSESGRGPSPGKSGE